MKRLLGLIILSQVLITDANEIARLKRAGSVFPPAAWYDSQLLENGQLDSDAFKSAVQFQQELLSSQLATEKLAVLLVTIALAVGGLIYFCIHITGIFPERVNDL